MKMPIVTLNQMAMNESIAASCCYTQMIAGNGTATVSPASYYKVLNGGSIVFNYLGGMEYRASTNYPANLLWLNIAGDYTPAATGLNTRYQPTQTVNGWVVYLDGAPDTTYKVAELQASCNHQNKATCFYYDIAQTVLPIGHVGATTAHAYGVKGEKNWATPHAATEYLS